jgi:hypothetical protein
MKRLPLVEVLIVNALLVPLLVLITENYGLRAAYWASEGFTSTTVRYPLFFITSAVKGAIHIPGIFSVDWQQVVLVVIVVTDAIYAWSARQGARAHEDLPAAE